MDDHIAKLVTRLSGYNLQADEGTMQTIVANADDELIAKLASELSVAHWPRCVALATLLSQIGGQSSSTALSEALKSKKHHTRTAAINGLATLGNPDSAILFEKMLNDPAYETRIAARDAICKLTGKKVKTAKGE